MYLLTVLSDTPYLIWQLQVQLYNIQKTQTPDLIKNHFVIIFYHRLPSSEILNYLLTHNIILIDVEKLPEEKKRMMNHYQALTKVVGLQIFTQHISHIWSLNLEDCVLLIDPDVIFLDTIEKRLYEAIDMVKKGKNWFSTDCSSYLGYDYLCKRLSEDQLQILVDECNISIHDLREHRYNTGGAQYLLPIHLPSDFCDKIIQSGYKIHNHLMHWKKNSMNKKYYNPWAAEMLSFFMTMILVNRNTRCRATIHPQMNHLLADYPYRFDTDRSSHRQPFILHLSGNTKQPGIFDKSLFLEKAPWSHPSFIDHIIVVQSNKKLTASHIYMIWLMKYCLTLDWKKNTL